MEKVRQKYEFFIPLEKTSFSIEKLIQHFHNWNMKKDSPYSASSSTPFSLESNSNSSTLKSSLESPYESTWSDFILHSYLILLTLYILVKIFVRSDHTTKTDYSSFLPLVLIECGLVNLTLILCFPLLFAFHFSIYITRLVVQFYLTYFFSSAQLQLLSGADSLWAVESPAHTSPFTCLYVLDGICDLNLLRDRILHKFVNKRDPQTGKLIYKRMKYCISNFLGFLCWRPDSEFNIENHVKLACMPNDVMTESQVFQMMGQAAHTMMDKEVHSPWEILVIPQYKFDTTNGEKSEGKKYFALVFRIHHGLMDGISAATALNYAVADYPVKVSVDPVNFRFPCIPWYVKLGGLAKFLIFGGRQFFWSLAIREKHEFTNKDLTGPKYMGWTRAFRLESVKSIRKMTGTSSTAVFASVFATALENLKAKMVVGGKRLEKIYAVQTLAMLPYPNQKPQNRFTIGHIGIDVRRCTSPLDRLYEAHKDVYAMASSYDLYLHFVMTHLIGRCPEWLTKFFLGISHASVIISNVPGPLEKCKILGSCVQHVAGWIPIKGKTGIGLALFSYGGTVRACFVADGAIFPNKSYLNALIKEYEKELLHLCKTVGLDQCFVSES